MSTNVINITKSKLYRRRFNNAWVLANLVRKGVIKSFTETKQPFKGIGIIVSPYRAIDIDWPPGAA